MSGGRGYVGLFYPDWACWISIRHLPSIYPSTLVSTPYHLHTTLSLSLSKNNPPHTGTKLSKQPSLSSSQNPTNRILAHVRPGGNRSLSHFNTLCARITEAWKHILKTEEEQKERELRAVFVLGTIVAGWEVGFALPPVRTYLSFAPSFISSALDSVFFFFTI